jgi:hypothetical protein
MLRDVEGLTAPEVVEVLGVSVQAVKSRLHRAPLGVRERVAPLLDADASSPPSDTCPDVLTMLSQHLEDEISAERCADMERHLEGVRTVPREVRLAQAHARALPDGSLLGPGSRRGPVVGEDGAQGAPGRKGVNPSREPRLLPAEVRQ